MWIFTFGKNKNVQYRGTNLDTRSAFLESFQGHSVKIDYERRPCSLII